MFPFPLQMGVPGGVELLVIMMIGMLVMIVPVIAIVAVVYYVRRVSRRLAGIEERLDEIE